MNQARWRRIAEWPLTIAALVFLVAYSWEVIGDVDGPRSTALEIVIDLTWAVFVVDYLVNLALAERRGRWFLTHLLDLAVVVLPIARPLRLLRLVTVLGVLHRRTRAAVRGRVLVYAAGASTLLVYVSALAMLDAEHAHGTIRTFGDALWWAIVTITTVGYGDYVPGTIEGRIIAAAVMVGGVALLGVVTATLASWIVDRVAEEERREAIATRRQVDDLLAQLVELREAVLRERDERRGDTPVADVTAHSDAAPSGTGPGESAAAAADAERTTTRAEPDARGGRDAPWDT